MNDGPALNNPTEQAELILSQIEAILHPSYFSLVLALFWKKSNPTICSLYLQAANFYLLAEKCNSKFPFNSADVWFLGIEAGDAYRGAAKYSLPPKSATYYIAAAEAYKRVSVDGPFPFCVRSWFPLLEAIYCLEWAIDIYQREEQYERASVFRVSIAQFYESLGNSTTLLARFLFWRSLTKNL